MALLIQKYGGTSVGSTERMKNLAARVLNAYEAGHKVVVVVSAMSGETNRLVGLAHEINSTPDSRDFDVLLASGEQASVGLVSLAVNAEARRRDLINKNEWLSVPLLAHQIGIITDKTYSKARIKKIHTERLEKEISLGKIPVIAGFQGVDDENYITTLGRGGSDTSAIAIGIALNAQEVEIYTDVDGIYTTDPRLCAHARKIEKISYSEMLEFASLGAKVLQIRSVELAAKYGISVHVRSSFNEVEGTRVMSEKNLNLNMEDVVVSGVAADRNQVKFTLQDIPGGVSPPATIFKALSKASIVVDIIILSSLDQNKMNISFTVADSDRIKTENILDQLKKEVYPQMSILQETSLSKVSIIGVGMQHHPGVAARMFELLTDQEIEIKLISTSEIKVSCLIADSKTKQAVEVLHEGFQLDKI